MSKPKPTPHPSQGSLVNKGLGRPVTSEERIVEISRLKGIIRDLQADQAMLVNENALLRKGFELLKKNLRDVLGHSNCYCENCSNLARTQFVPRGDE